MKEISCCSNPTCVKVVLENGDRALLLEKYDHRNHEINMLMDGEEKIFTSIDVEAKEEFIELIKAASCNYTDVNGNIL